ncbi:uncharacterized protein LOC125485855 isoform X5 [Rhincodon typus]|uniref:uncharacterized protein LOC125485855 isoform X5 n=1 Tax=Rhincodon typus TaxID=259920 RepID=UPI00202DC44A|nr:uncharacterized protein LOC125485855 isoform X5 [Rhincodon typus]
MPPMLQGTRPAQNRLCLCHCYASPLQAHLADDAGSRTGPRFASATAPMNLRWKQTALGTQTRLRHRYKSVLLGLAATATKLFTNNISIVIKARTIVAVMLSAAKWCSHVKNSS